MDAIKAAIWAADTPTILDRLIKHGNPAVRKAAEHIGAIASDHARHDYNRCREMEHANDALFYLPMPEIEKLCAEYSGRA